MALVVLTRLPAEGTALFESASIAAWALSARVAACWLPPDQILPRKACESLVAGAAAGALYLAHADATLLATIRLVCLAGALNSAGRAHVAGALLAAAVEAPRLRDGVPRGEPGLAGRGGAAAAPRRVALRGPRGRAAGPRRRPRGSWPVRKSNLRSTSTPSTRHVKHRWRGTQAAPPRRFLWPRRGSLCHTGGGRARAPRPICSARNSAAALPLFAAAAAYAARRLRAQHASSLGDAFARQDGRAGAGADAAAFASYAAAARARLHWRRHRAAAGWGVVLCAAPVLLFLRVPRKEGRRLPSLISSGSYERRHVTAAVNFLRGAAWVLALHGGSRSRRSAAAPPSFHWFSRSRGRRRRRGRDARPARRGRRS